MGREAEKTHTLTSSLIILYFFSSRDTATRYVARSRSVGAHDL